MIHRVPTTSLCCLHQRCILGSPLAFTNSSTSIPRHSCPRILTILTIGLLLAYLGFSFFLGFTVGFFSKHATAFHVELVLSVFRFLPGFLMCVCVHKCLLFFSPLIYVTLRMCFSVSLSAFVRSGSHRTKPLTLVNKYSYNRTISFESF